MNTIDDVIDAVFREHGSAVSCVQASDDRYIFFNNDALPCAEVEISAVNTHFGVMHTVNYTDFANKLTENNIIAKAYRIRHVPVEKT